MRANEERRDAHEERLRCQIAHVPGKPSSTSCAEPPIEDVDGLLLCEGHALEVKLEGQIYCWAEMLFHIELWSREAKRRDRPEVVGLLQDERAQAIYARGRAYEDLNVLRRSEKPSGEAEEVPSASGGEELLSRIRRGSLPLPPTVARPLARGLGRLRRR